MLAPASYTGEDTVEFHCHGGVKSVIAVVPQETAVAEHLTGVENLRLMADLHGIPAQRAKQRSEQVLEVLGLTSRAGQQARKYSGGLKRRLSIAMALVSDPEVVFLDIWLPDRDGLETLQALREIDEAIDFIVVDAAL